VAALREFIGLATKEPFEGMTNEAVCKRLFDEISRWATAWRETDGRGSFELDRLELAVRCVSDELGHADIVCTYVVEVEAAERE
jgi:hypothetical protein